MTVTEAIVDSNNQLERMAADLTRLREVNAELVAALMCLIEACDKAQERGDWREFPTVLQLAREWLAKAQEGAE